MRLTIRQRLRRYQFNPKIYAEDRAIGKLPVFENYDGSLPVYRVNARIAVNPSPKYVYFRIPKAANSTIIATLSAGNSPCELGSWDETEALKRSFKRPSEVGSLQSNIHKYTKFVFCRQPAERAVSAYLDKLCRPSKQQILVRRLLRLDESATLTFDRYLTFLEEHDGCNLDGHFARQSDICFLDNTQLDFIGRFENLETDLIEIYYRIFGRRTEITSWRPHKTRNDFALTFEQKSRLERIYENDFEKFNY